MTTHDLDELISVSARVSDDDVARLDLPWHQLAADLDLNLYEDAQPGHVRHWSVLGRRRRLVAAAAILVAIAMTQFLTSSSSRWAAAAVRVAETSPRLIVEGATITRVDEFAEGKGEMTFTTDSGVDVDLSWADAVDHGGLVADRADSNERQQDVTVAGSESSVYRYVGTNTYTALWLLGDTSVEVRAAMDDFDEFRVLLGTIRSVDIDTWLASMPASSVAPAGRDAAIEAMLEGIPLPPGFAIDDVPDGAGVSDRYQLGVAVTGNVACQWLLRWSEAIEQGDDDAASAAVDAMSTSAHWPLLLEMSADGDWPDAIREYADAMAGTQEVRTGRPMGVFEAARYGLGCDEHWR